MLTEDNALVNVSYTDIDSSKSIRFETVPNVEYLRRVLEVGLPEINEDVSMNTIYRLYAYLLYEGLTEQEIVNITKDEARIGDDNILKYNGKKIYIQPFLKKILNHVIETDEIAWAKFGRIDYIKLAPSNYLIGAVRALDNRLGNFKNIISKLNKLYINGTGKYIRLSASRIYESGVFYRTLQSELDTGEIDEQLIIDAFDIREEKYSTQNIYQIQVYNAKKDYESWKKAWHYE